MPVIINEKKYLGLKVANGSEFLATGIVVDEDLSIFFGPPCGNLMTCET